MYKKLTTLVLAIAALVIFSPATSYAAVSSEKSTTVTVSESSATNSLAPQRRNRRWNNRRWNNNRRVRVIRQVYYRNGRRYVRIVRVRY